MTFFFEAFLLLFKKWLYFIQLSNYAAKIRFNIYTVYTYIYQDMRDDSLTHGKFPRIQPKRTGFVLYRLTHF